LSQIDAESIDAYVTARGAEYIKKPGAKHKAGERCATCDQRVNPATINRDLAVLRHMLRLASGSRTSKCSPRTPRAISN
jgi:hypothetical protein